MRSDTLILSQIGSGIVIGTVGIGLAVMSGNPTLIGVTAVLVGIDLFFKYQTISRLAAEMS